MTTHIALLRAINVAGHQPVSMGDLRALLTGLGFANVRSLLQSGNLVFDSSRKTPAQLERLLETEAEKRLGLATEFLVRTAEEWDEVVCRNPFADAAKNDPARVVVLFTKEAVQRFEWSGPEIVKPDGRQVYVIYPNGQGRSRLKSPEAQRATGTRC